MPAFALSISAVVIGLLFASSGIGSAQTPRTQPARSKASTDVKSPQQHLDEAKRILAGVNEASLSGEASKRFAALESGVNELAAAYLKRTDRGSPGSVQRDEQPTAIRGTNIPGSAADAPSKDWRTAYPAVERALLDLVGSGSNSPSGSSTATTAPPSGGVANLDALVRGQLQEVRSHLILFYAGTMGEADARTPKK